MLILIFFALIVIIAAFSLHMYRNAHRDFVRYQALPHHKLPAAFNGYTIFFIADLHRRNIRGDTLESINKQIDLVCIGGDILEKGVPLERVKHNIKKLQRWNVPIVFVYGNNDYETDIQQLENLFADLNVIVLEDDIMPISLRSEQIMLVGFKYEQECSETKSDIDWESLEDYMTILLTHKPSGYFKLNESVKEVIDTVLAGHTHGGQIRIFGMGPYERGSLKKMHNTTILQSEGYGCSLLPFRLGTQAECHVLTLNHASYNHRETD